MTIVRHTTPTADVELPYAAGSSSRLERPAERRRCSSDPKRYYQAGRKEGTEPNARTCIQLGPNILLTAGTSVGGAIRQTPRGRGLERLTCVCVRDLSGLRFFRSTTLDQRPLEFYNQYSNFYTPTSIHVRAGPDLIRS
jgi:hypothetical protein